MKINSPAEDKIIVDLTKQDMLELDITYDELDYSNIETRRVLWTLLDEAGHRLGRSISLASQMLIEAVPSDDGGCILYFTVADDEYDSCVSYGGNVWKPKNVCQSDSIDNIGALSRALYNSDCVSHSELYTDGSRYRLIIAAKPACCEKIRTIAGEYCDVFSHEAVAVTDEHWKLLASPDAIGILTALS